MWKKVNARDFECSAVAGARLADLSVSESAVLPGFSSIMFTANGPKKRIFLVS